MTLSFHKRERCYRCRANRRGQSLVLMFFTLVALIGVLALTLDYGFVLLARRQMQTGVNAAALEGLRDYDGTGRENARDLLRIAYDDDLDPSENETTIGAGIDTSLVQGDGYQSVTIGTGSGLPATLANRSQYIYRPDPELNADNEVHGDLVRGDFDPSARPNEYSTYRRDGFTPNPNGNAFLSRLRRTHNPNGLDQVPGVSSSGGGMPLIIGHLAWFAVTDPQANYSIRREGVTVRATAITYEQVAVRVWETEQVSVSVYQPLPYVLSADSLKAFYSTGTPLAFESRQGVPDSPFTFVGQLVGPLQQHSAPAGPGYVAVYADISMSTRVIGFYVIHPDPTNLLLHNASARLQDAWSKSDDMTEELWTQIRIAQDAEEIRPHLLKSPVLTRSIR